MGLLALSTIGCDPEIFIKRGTDFVSAHGLIPGTKAEPYPVNDGSVQVDGTALEIGITPSHTVTQFIDCIKSVTNQLKGMIPADVELSYTPTAKFDPNYFKSLPETATELGCEPDYNAWTLGVNPKPAGDQPMRTASGHLHVGWTTDAEMYSAEHFERCALVVRELDYYLGVMSLDWDTDTERRSLYGKAGAFRPKVYGLEYRVLSNAWLTSDQTMAYVFNTLKKCLANIDNDIILVNEFGDLAINIINSSNTNWRNDYPELAARLLELGV